MFNYVDSWSKGIVWGRGILPQGGTCPTCKGKGYTVSESRYEAFDDIRYYTCGDCLDDFQRKVFKQQFGDESLTPREAWLCGVPYVDEMKEEREAREELEKYIKMANALDVLYALGLRTKEESVPALRADDI